VVLAVARVAAAITAKQSSINNYIYEVALLPFKALDEVLCTYSGTGKVKQCWHRLASTQCHRRSKRYIIHI
jgi:hypothetical protein